MLSFSINSSVNLVTLPGLITVIYSVIINISLSRDAFAATSTSTTTAVPANLTTLQLVQVIARHGDRAPLLPFPTDIYKNASLYSINGWGELSEIGAKQVFELGTYLRQRYDGFLPKKYRKRDFLMLSSDIDRAIMSAECCLAGLYELGPIPRSRDIFKEWQPVPIHTIAKEDDNFIEAKASCPLHDKLFKEYMNSEEHLSFIEENKEFINFVANMSGLPEIQEDFELIFRVHDALQCQISHNLTLPTWANSTVIERLKEFKRQSFFWPLQTFETKRLRVGPLLERLVGKMKAKVEAFKANIFSGGNGSDDNDEIPPYQDFSPYRKFYIYSAHDSTITSLLSVLSPVSHRMIPPYASALILELHRMPETGAYFVELFYKNETTQPIPHLLDLESFCNSSLSCSFESFAINSQKYIPTNWKGECQVQTSSGSVMPSEKPTSGTMSGKRLMKMKMVPAGGDFQADNINEDERHMALKHPLGMAAPGLPGFVLAVTAVTSLLVSAAMLLSFFYRNHRGASHLPAGHPYQHMS